MKRPSPLLLLMGGGALINVALMLNGYTKAPVWLRHGGMALLIAFGVASLLLALRMAFEKKPERTKYQSKRAAPVDLAPETKAKGEPGGAKRSAKPKFPPPPST